MSSAGDCGSSGGRPLARGPASFYSQGDTMKQLLIFLVLIPLLACAGARSHSRIATALEAVEVYDETNEWQGSGIVVRCDPREDGKFDVLVLTSAHIIHTTAPEAQDFDLYRGDGGDDLVTDVGELVEKHPTLDAVLLLFVSPIALDVSLLTYREPRVGERVLAAGYPSDEFYFAEGLIVSATKMSAPIALGSSGGPVISLGGAVIGISEGVGFYRIAPGNYWFHINHQATYVSLSSLKDWLREHDVVE